MVANYFNIVDRVSYVVKEAYRINPNKMTGVLVSVELSGAIKAGLAEVGIRHSDILPQTWRSILGIKPVKDSKGKRDFKTPTKDYVETLVKVPEEMQSNITHKMRGTPSDVYDATAIGIAFLKKVGIKGMDFSQVKFQSHVGMLND
jgi:hypothetical protein